VIQHWKAVGEAMNYCMPRMRGVMLRASWLMIELDAGSA
jgi:hypothetical protein